MPVPVKRTSTRSRTLPVKSQGRHSPTRQAMGALLHEMQTKGALSFESIFRRGAEYQILFDVPADPYTQVWSVYVAVSRIATSAAALDWVLSEDTGRGQAQQRDFETHDLYQMITAQLLEGTYALLDLKGKAFWRLLGIGDGAREPQGIELLRGDVTPDEAEGTRELLGWKHSDRGKQRRYLPEEIVPFLYFHPDEPHDGLSPLSAARLSYSLSWKSTKSQELFYGQGGMPPFYYYAPKDVPEPDKDELKRMRNDFEQKFTGLRRFWKIPFLFQGTELRTIAVNQRDAEWMATQMLSTKQIMAIYGVPMSVAGFTEDANRSISTSELRFFWGGTIHNRATMVSGIIQERILKVYYPRVLFRYLWEQKFAEVMPEERRSAIASAHVMVTDGIPPVDAYGTVGITLNTEGKPWLETGWMPIGMMPAEDLLEGGGDLLSEGGDGAGEGEGAGVRRRRSRLHRGAWPSSETIRAALWRGMERKRASVERVYLGRWRSFLTWMRDDTIRRIQEADAEKGGELGQALDPGKQAYPNIRGLLCRAAGDNLVPPESEVGRTALERVKAAALLAAKIGWQSLMDQVGLDIAFEGADPRVLALLAARTQKIVGASIRARDRITDAIGTGIDKGESTSQIVERVHAVHREAYVGQAKVVAETEVGSVFGNARYVAMQEAGIGKSEWLTSRMSNVRPSHAAQDGEVRNLGEPFPNGLRWPQEPGAPPEESMNCHCVCLPVTS